MAGLRYTARWTPGLSGHEQYMNWADEWIAPNGPNITARHYQDFLTAAAVYNKPYRGAHLLPRYFQRSHSWQSIKEYAAGLCRQLPDATGWDVIHECHGIHTHRGWWGDAANFIDWAVEAVIYCRQIAPRAKLYLSELRPQDRFRWRWALETMEQLADRGAPLDGLSVQLHSNLLSRQPLELEWLADALRACPWEVQCFEVMAFDLVAATIPHRPPTHISEQLQAQRYEWYRDWAERAGATMFGPWHLWDGIEEKYWQPIETAPGIFRRDWSPKPAASLFIKNPPD